jgi:acetyl esterase/lipase
VIVGQASVLAEQPEFSGAENLRRLLSLTEEPARLADALRRKHSGDVRPEVSITIGGEHGDPRLDRFTVVTAEYHAGALAGVIGLSGPYDFVIGEYAPIFGPPSQWPNAQAVKFVDGDEPPFLLVHGERDRVVEFRDSPELAGLLRAAGGTARVVPIPGGGHSAPLAGLYDPRRSPAVLPAILGFIADPER